MDKISNINLKNELLHRGEVIKNEAKGFFAMKSEDINTSPAEDNGRGQMVNQSVY